MSCFPEFIHSGKQPYAILEDLKNAMKNRVPQQHRKRTAALLSRACAIVLALAACVSPRGTKVPSEAERARQAQANESLLVAEVEGRWTSFGDAVLEKHVLETARQLGLQSRPRVEFLRSSASDPPLVVLPARRWYFSLSVLRGLRYENEFAALVALAVALDADPSVAVLQAHDLIALTYEGLSRKMVELLYQARFDPRGVATFWAHRAEALSDPGRARAVRFQEEARTAVARRVPLSNPVVRRRQFGEIVSRLKEF